MDAALLKDVPLAKGRRNHKPRLLPAKQPLQEARLVGHKVWLLQKVAGVVLKVGDGPMAHARQPLLTPVILLPLVSLVRLVVIVGHLFQCVVVVPDGGKAEAGRSSL